jgi:lysophospholipase L1-like esterase
MLLLAFTTLMLSSVFAANAASTDKPTDSNFVPASDARFLYEGRFDPSRLSAGPVVIWQGSRIRLDFEGDSLALHFTDVQGQNFFDAEIDGRTTLVELISDAPARGTTFSGLGAGRHRLVLFKRSEAAAGTVRFRGVELGSDAEAFAPKPPSYRRAMLFIGDSITAAACNEDGAEDQWEDRRTHNNAKSYGAFTAAAFDANYRNIAVSGMGIAIGYTPIKAGETWDRVYPDPRSPRADLAAWTPDIVFVNLGENDDSYPRSQDIPFPAADYTEGYVALAQALRVAYPGAQIVILRGGMFGGAQSERLRLAWETAVTRMESSDPKLTHFVFSHWAKTHPRVADHRAMADELTAWLRTQPFIR